MHTPPPTSPDLLNKIRSSPNAWCNEVSVATVFSSAVF